MGLAYRMGNGGWPKDDKKAAELFMLIATHALENNKDRQEEKAKSMAAIADFWAADPANGMAKNDSEIEFYLSQAARLYRAYANEYADWCAYKKSKYFSKERAVLHYNRYITWLKEVETLATSADMPIMVKLMTDRINETNKKIARL